LVWQVPTDLDDINFRYAILPGVVHLFNCVLTPGRTMLLFDMAGIALFTIVGVEKV